MTQIKWRALLAAVRLATAARMLLSSPHEGMPVYPQQHTQSREPTEAYRALPVLALRPDLRFTISARGKPQGLPVLRFLARHYPTLPIAQVDSLFGFVEHTTLYGGRVFREAELSPRDLGVMYEVGIGLRLPLSNHYVDEDEYERNRAFLERHHRAGNSVIVTNDDLARWIRRDYPAYRVEASVIKHLQSYARIDAALETYHTVILLARVITSLGTLPAIDTGVIEGMFTADLAFLQELYRAHNELLDTAEGMVRCPSCGEEFVPVGSVEEAPVPLA